MSVSETYFNESFIHLMPQMNHASLCCPCDGVLCLPCCEYSDVLTCREEAGLLPVSSTLPFPSLPLCCQCSGLSRTARVSQVSARWGHSATTLYMMFANGEVSLSNLTCLFSLFLSPFYFTSQNITIAVFILSDHRPSFSVCFCVTYLRSS